MNATALDPRLWWFMSRASGMAAFGVLAASCALGLVFASRVGKNTGNQAWLLSLHRFLGALFLVTTGVHLAALAADGYVGFGPRELFVPFASSWRPGAVAIGILALYAAVCVELSSLVMRRIPRSLWRAVHLSSYAVFLAVIAHAVLAGSDAGSLLFAVGGTACIAVVACLGVLRIWVRKAPAERRRGQRPGEGTVGPAAGRLDGTQAP